MSLEHAPVREAGKEDAARSPPHQNGRRLAYSIDEFCEKAGIGRSFVYQEIRAGRLKARKAGRRTLILRDDGERYLRDLPSKETAA